MPQAAAAYLVVRREDGFGDVFPLHAGARCTLGRAATNRVVLKDELCSREHAEVFRTNGQWYVRDMGSLNGTRLNNVPVSEERVLEPKDDILVGKTHLIFVEEMQQLPDVPRANKAAESPPAIRKRVAETRFLKTADTVVDGQTTVLQAPFTTDRVERDLARLYRLALDMGSVDTTDELVRIVLDGLLNAIPADVGAILALGEGRELELLAYRHRDPSVQTYHKVSQFVSSEVLASREAILAEDVARDEDLSKRESLAELKATSLICAPIRFGEQILGLIHLYCITREKTLDGDDLEFASAVAQQLGTSLHQLRVQASLESENTTLRSQLQIESELIGESAAIREIESQIARVAATQATVLVRGESGSGKELVARAIHYSSQRKGAPFVTLNCAALTETLLESELFGHEKGAFTGATEKMIGKFEAADKGTIFLDEIGEMAMGTQAKFLRVLEGHTFERVGGNNPIKVNVRVVAATNQPLEQNVREGTFRKDLFYRLQVVEISVPPLRERIADVSILAEHFLKRFVRETGRRIRGFTPAALTRMREHDWPGNVRELRNVVERAVALGTGPLLDAGDIWLPKLDADAPLAHEFEYQPLSIEEMERVHILRTLNHTDWNKSRAAEILGIERSTLDRKIKAYGLQKD